VLAVIFFHAGFAGFSGGFVGVDIFFVLSGYLITSIIIRELATGRFTVKAFYERRVRRILPPLFLVMAVSIPFAWMLFPPPEMTDFSQSLVAVTVFGSNFFFWLETGYFSTASELPLLHTWSLGVEEQFYFLFPLFLLLTWRLGRRWIVVLIIFAGVLSLLLAQWASFEQPVAAFYLLPTRIWELLIGSLAAFALSRSYTQLLFSKKIIGEFGGWIGISLILFSVFSFSSATPFPGFYATVPTLGTLLVILCASEDTYLGKFLSTRLLVGIGLVSYSAYLWHQPIFVFGKDLAYSGLSLPLSFFFIGLTFTLAFLSWKYVETPFRDKKRISAKFVLVASVISSMVFIALGLWGHFSRGFEMQTDGGLASRSAQESRLKTSSDFIIIGDSHGEHLIYGLETVTSGQVTDFTSAGCIPLRNVDRYDSRFIPGTCVTKMNGFLDRIILENPDAVVILSSMGPVYLDGTSFKGIDEDRVTGLGVELITDPTITDRWQVFEIGLRQTLGELSKLDRSQIVFSIDVPELGIEGCSATPRKEVDFGLFSLRDRATEVDECHVSRLEYDNRTERYRNLVHKVAADFPKVRVFDPTDVFCSRELCMGLDETFGYLYRDADHLSSSGSLFFAESFVAYLSSDTESLNPGQLR